MNSQPNQLFLEEQLHTLTIQPGGWTLRVSGALPLIAAARAAGVVLPSSCRNGTCRTCLCRLVSGEIRYAVAWPGISADEREEGLILPCVAHAASDLVLEEPRALRPGPSR